jgi:excisionase family DNA binding protein
MSALQKTDPGRARILQVYLTQAEAADVLHVSERTLERWRLEGRGQTYTKAGHRVLYRASDIEEWLQSRRRQSTSEIPEG